MPQQYNESPPVGVVPRREAAALDILMSDIPERWSVADEVQCPAGEPSAISQWLTGATALGLLATAMEWLKLTR